MKLYKKLIILSIIILCIPVFKVNYFNGEEMEIRKYSVISLIIQDLKDGTIGTRL